MPPHAGWWLARSNRGGHGGFYDLTEYLRPLTKAEFAYLSDAHEHFQAGEQWPEVLPLFSAYEDWRSRIKSEEESTLGGPVLDTIIEARLVSFLLVWRMALDQLARATSSRFGKESKQWEAHQAGRRRAYDSYFGYRLVDAIRNRVQHEENPPLTISMQRHTYICEKCNKKHMSHADLTVTISTQWLLASKDCPRLLRQDLTDRGDDFVDIRAAIAESMQVLKIFYMEWLWRMIKHLAT